MLWFFEKQCEKLHFEVRGARDGRDFELVITHPDGRVELETFSDLRALADRSRTLRTALADAGWQSPPLLSRLRASRQSPDAES
jgi:hypothetical protein